MFLLIYLDSVSFATFVCLFVYFLYTTRFMVNESYLKITPVTFCVRTVLIMSLHLFNTALTQHFFAEKVTNLWILLETYWFVLIH